MQRTRTQPLGMSAPEPSGSAFFDGGQAGRSGFPGLLGLPGEGFSGLWSQTRQVAPPPSLSPHPGGHRSALATSAVPQANSRVATVIARARIMPRMSKPLHRSTGRP